MVINPSFPAKTVPDFVAYAHANPSSIRGGKKSAAAGMHRS
jgi:tripartite-type tricarboxylate transporter receptor subunit TctC